MTEQENKVVNALRQITNNFENISGTSTLLEWTDQYDLEGRIVSCNPNSRMQYFNIEGKEYTVFRARWKVRIYSGQQGFTDTDDSNLITTIDLEPNYVKAYWKRKGY